MKPAYPTLILFALLGANANAQTFVLDPDFGSNGIATYEWPASNGYQWDAVDAWAARQTDGKWAVATQLRDGTNQIAAVNWFEANGQVTPPSPAAGPYTPFTRSAWNLAGVLEGSDGALVLGTSVRRSATDIDFLLFKSRPNGSDGYNACNGTFFQTVFFDLAPPSFMEDVMGGLTQDFAARHVLVGTLATTGGESRIGVARLQPFCGLDPSLGGGKVVIDPNPYQVFPPPRRARANTVTHDPFGRILIGGGVTFGLNSTDDGACIVVRLLGDGQRDGSFGNNGVAYINSFTDTPGNIRCDVRGLSALDDGSMIVNMDWTLTTAQGTSHREYNHRLTIQGTYDPNWFDPCCTVGFSNSDVRSGGGAVLEADGVALTVSSSLTSQIGVDDASAELIPLRLSNGTFPPGFIASGQRPLGLDSTSYHRIVIESPDYFVVVATSGADFLNHRRVHLLRYRRATTLPDDLIFRDGFDP